MEIYAKDKEMKSQELGLDLLRVLAAVGVFLCHFGQYINLGKLGEVFLFGAHGVQIFFVLSGFLIMQSLERSESLKEYARKRFNRLFPMYWGMLICMIVANQFIWGNVPKDSYAHLGWLRYFFCLQRVIPANEVFWDNLYGLWTMSAFVLFYLIAPAIAQRVKTFRGQSVCLLEGFSCLS